MSGGMDSSERKHVNNDDRPPIRRDCHAYVCAPIVRRFFSGCTSIRQPEAGYIARGMDASRTSGGPPGTVNSRLAGGTALQPLPQGK
ncbi:hypothetical protein PC41400_22010 [Paenibacillus chitinolyticus]|uniref:Uncharacterized protein n=1 Tax=Paenibacillus chitinolyticus TaxID=79263 RepID=A0A410X0S3_9BACL|nr:hypothetical protein [Paenibacillus chitinolyticus]MCY9588443.1 hypothetical protein [Paenibacillus chitinolyticus]MCY9597813.1 hypothetical protein [Paenibacillus chitinolyticus]QAV20197.1 hypothetical protein PC41400_22010 [Paenibacillus chitinolyticus]